MFSVTSAEYIEDDVKVSRAIKTNGGHDGENYLISLEANQSKSKVQKRKDRELTLYISNVYNRIGSFIRICIHYGKSSTLNEKKR